ncbi:MAG TPA: YdcF family protein [Terracidiphilus sp.]|jgi:uncharacterized SAM-binding protein YcdF (DUF218 family)
MSVRTRVILASIAVVIVLVAWAALARGFAPLGNTSATRFDALIVLGSPADAEGNPTPVQLSRVTEAVHEYERGVASHLILSGGPSHHSYVEAEVMAHVAEAQGVPSSSIVVEPKALDTIQNACYSERLMKAHGWRSAEVISNKSHLPRAGLIFSRLPIEWRTHAAPSLEPDIASPVRFAVGLETLKTLRYLVFAQWAERCAP